MNDNWAQDYMDSVAWSDKIVQGIHVESGIEYLSFEVEGSWKYLVQGDLNVMHKAIIDGLTIKQSTNCSTSILFTNKEATEAQVEEAIHTAGGSGLGCGFLEAKPTFLWYGLLDKYSEGTLMEQALKLMQEGS
jgi:hypothetical protein